ncbi:MAG: short-chain dehydrogenase [Candidatus Epulonipiscioides saccharophilum]|nr:MAG: short-chain dehydrogenase [Epulopiscium sp. AS2M-Bin001]
MKNCIITGGSHGIGLETAKKFIESGYNVIVLDIKECPLKSAEYICMDLSKTEDIEKAFKIIEEKYKKVHVLINDGAVASFHKGIEEVLLEDYERILNTNLRGAYFCAKEFIRLNNGEEYGRIINIASTRFHQNEENVELYGMSKGGIVSMTNSLCISLTGTPITVNAISPGYICTTDYSKLDKRDHEIHPSNRVGKPRDIANVCLFLANEENDFINGANIIVDGGMTKKMIY